MYPGISFIRDYMYTHKMITENPAILNNYKSSEKIEVECDYCHKGCFKNKDDLKASLKHNRKNYFCSRSCLGNNRVTALSANCDVCNKEFSRSITHMQRGNHTFCSRKCSNIGLSIPKIELFCYYCDNKYFKFESQIKHNKNTFCSRSCRAKSNCRIFLSSNFVRSKLEVLVEKEISETFPKLKIIFNDREVIGIELDIYIPDLKLAFEINGTCHYNPIYGNDKLLKIQEKDIEKKARCKNNNIDLFVLDISKQDKVTLKSSEKYLRMIEETILEYIEYYK